MKDFLVYTLLRLGLFLLTWAAVTGAWLLVAGEAALGLTFLIAFLLSGIGSYFVLSGPRDRLARHVETRADRAIERARTKEDEEDDAAEAAQRDADAESSRPSLSKLDGRTGSAGADETA
ncbi:DUF4229 domain-containing protein [Nocardioides sp. GXZ039]|uniref:DUF4229 domain-containing protein n=1 Tax=Nocardioides sp. GXZ039 TaxID=3136018 RepID=UPI0030F49A3F